VEVAELNKRWFLPQSVDLLGMLHEQMAVTCQGLEAFERWAGGDAASEAAVRDLEHQADAKKRALWKALQDAFTTPIDAEDLYTLSALLDTVLNGVKDLVRESDLLALAPDGPSAEMAGQLREGVDHLATAFEQLATHQDGATGSADAAVKSERNLERVYRRAMSALLDVEDLREVMGRREIYRRFARVGDRLVETADRVWYAVVKEA
jgi:uncharacterized protein Yka (UPF0111/DUF47 family)